MKTKILSGESPEAILRAVRVLQKGGLVAFPTDTVYGIGALVFNENAVESIFVAKDRPLEKAIPVLLSGAGQVGKVASSMPEMAKRLASRFWPGPLTLVIPKKPGLPVSVSATDTIGVRMPDDRTALALLKEVGPMAVTSANISGGANPSSADEVFAQMNGRIELILDGGRTSGGMPSTVVDCTKDKPFILRVGPVSLEEITSALV